MKRGSFPPARAIAATHNSGIAKVKARYAVGWEPWLENATEWPDTGQDGARHIANGSPPEVGPSPGGGILSGTQGVISRNVPSDGRFFSHPYPPDPIGSPFLPGAGNGA